MRIGILRKQNETDILDFLGEMTEEECQIAKNELTEKSRAKLLAGDWHYLFTVFTGMRRGDMFLMWKLPFIQSDKEQDKQPELYRWIFLQCKNHRVYSRYREPNKGWSNGSIHMSHATFCRRMVKYVGTLRESDIP